MSEVQLYHYPEPRHHANRYNQYKSLSPISINAYYDCWTCPAITGCDNTWTHVNSAAQTARFPEIALEDEENDIMLFATFIENRDSGNSTDVVGFDGATHDFQFMVPDKKGAPTETYYFYIEFS